MISESIKNHGNITDAGITGLVRRHINDHIPSGEESLVYMYLVIPNSDKLDQNSSIHIISYIDD